MTPSTKAQHPTQSVWAKLRRTLRHRWYDERDARNAVPVELAQRLQNYVKASETRHSGEIRICVEASLPISYLWRNASLHERAVTLFGKLRVWDTEHNNGVLIYLLLAERRIELVADRGLNQKVTQVEWQQILDGLSAALKGGRFEEGLTQALAEVSALMVQHFPVVEGETNSNDLPDALDLR